MTTCWGADHDDRDQFRASDSDGKMAWPSRALYGLGVLLVALSVGAKPSTVALSPATVMHHQGRRNQSRVIVIRDGRR